MFTCNLLTSFSLVNGKTGTSTLHGIVWGPSNDSYTTLLCMLLLFIPDHYPEDGPCLFRNINNHPVVPLLPITWIGTKGVANTLEQYFRLYWHMLKRIVIDISRRYFQTALTYVGISRVKELGGIIFDCFFFDISRFTEKPNNIRLLRIQD